MPIDWELSIRSSCCVDLWFTSLVVVVSRRSLHQVIRIKRELAEVEAPVANTILIFRCGQTVPLNLTAEEALGESADSDACVILIASQALERVGVVLEESLIVGALDKVVLFCVLISCHITRAKTNDGMDLLVVITKGC